MTDGLFRKPFLNDLQVASALLKDGQTERALEFARPVLTQMNVHTIGFISELRTKECRGSRSACFYAANRAEASRQSDANTVSGLSSYVFTPGFT